MILHALNEYYLRERSRPGSEIAPPGWIRRSVDYELLLDESGQCILMSALFEVVKGYRRGRTALLPSIGKQALKHTNSGGDANLLWDNAGFTLGRGKHGAKKIAGFAACIDEWFAGLTDPGVEAVRRFTNQAATRPAHIEELLTKYGAVADFDLRDPVLIFRLHGRGPEAVHEAAAVVAAYESARGRADARAVRGRCLVTGLSDQCLAQGETVIKGVARAQPAGANIVSFNARSFVSYGKDGRQAEAAPISQAASSAYSTSLNHLLASYRQRIQVGDASTVFWADRPSLFDSEFTLADLFGDTDDPARNTRAVQALFEAVQAGTLAGEEGAAKFFVLGLAPNQGRLSIRFWLHAPLSELAPRIAQHFRDLALTPQFDSDPRTPSLSRLLRSLAVQEKAESVPPRLAGEWMRAILEGLAYPRTLLNAAVMRCRAEQTETRACGNVPYLRAAILKAWLNRDHRAAQPALAADHAEFKEELDMQQPDVAYRLGRLFALLERIQEESARPAKLNATIRDRFYGAASTTPVAVFTTLLRLKNAHVKKLDPGLQGYYEKQIGEVLGSVEAPAVADFPTQFTLPEQARFALGYYHQRQSFFKRKDGAAPDTNPEE